MGQNSVSTPFLAYFGLKPVKFDDFQHVSAEKQSKLTAETGNLVYEPLLNGI